MPHSARTSLGRWTPGFAGLGFLTALAGCMAAVPAPMTDAPPRVALASGWRAPVPHGGSVAAMEGWWQAVGDPDMARIQALAMENSPTLQSAAAAIRVARAQAQEAGAAPWPSLSASDSAKRGGSLGGGSAGVGISRTATLDASWEPDIFGGQSASARAALLRASGAEASWNDARVSLMAEVADDYAQYRACRQIAAIYRDGTASQQETIRATQALATSGLSSEADLALARASAAAANITLTTQLASCDILAKSTALAAGVDEGQIRPDLDRAIRIPRVPPVAASGVPADLIRQRPDIAASEADLAAALADVGVARADLMPSLSLGGALTRKSGVTSWTFGPALSLSLPKPGVARATMAGAMASYDKAAASYRSTVLQAVSQAETAMINLDAARRKLGDATLAADNYQSYFTAVDANWRAGGASLLDREEARREAQSARITVIELRLTEVQQWIALYKAMGGGWQAGRATPTAPTAISPAAAQG